MPCLLADNTLSMTRLHRRFTAGDALSVIFGDQPKRLAEKVAAQGVPDAAGPFIAWARKNLRVRTKEGGVAPLDLWALQRRYLARKRLARMQGKPRKFLLLKYRRGGYTTLEQGESFHLVTSRPNMSALTLAHDSESTEKIFRISQFFQRSWHHAPKIKGVGNAHRLEYPELNSLFYTGTAGSTGLARGDTLQRVHGSEVSQWCKGPRQIDKQAEILAGITEAASHGEIVLETTPRGVEHFCHLYRDAKRGLNDWTPIFLRWFDDRNNTQALGTDEVTEIRDTLSDRERDLMAREGLSWGQVAWRRRKVRELGRLFPQEYPEDDESCFITSGHRFFDVERVVQLLESLADYKREHVPGGYIVRWAPPEPRVEYVAGCDTSEGVPGCDPNGIGILRRDNGEQVAAAHGMFNPSRLAEIGVGLCKEYNDALLGVERENHGHAVIQRVGQLGYTAAGRQLFWYAPSRPGWSTNAQTRPVLLDELAEAIAGGHMKVRDRDMLQECLTFGLQGPGRWEHDAGEHDDAIFKWAIAWQMRKVRRAAPQLRYV